MDKSKLNKALLAEMLNLKDNPKKHIAMQRDSGAPKQNTQAEIKPEIKEPLPIKEKLPLDDTGSELKNPSEYERLRAYIDVHFNLYRGQPLRPGWPVIRTPLECVESLLRLSIIENDEKEIKKRFQAIELLIRTDIEAELKKYE